MGPSIWSDWLDIIRLEFESDVDVDVVPCFEHVVGHTRLVVRLMY